MDEELLCEKFANKLSDFAVKAEAFMSPDAIWTAFIAAAFSYAKAHGVPETRIVEHLRGAADALEASEPPAPAVN